MKTLTAEVLLTPESEELRFLPEGPYTVDDDTVSWVAIQHGADATTGSLNLLSLGSGTNRSIGLNGRPGFAFPCSTDGRFIVGLERRVAIVDVESGEESLLADEIDGDVENSIINDGVVFENNLIFGCKELEFKTPKAGLYLYRSHDQKLIRLRNDQICSNGKAVITADGQTTLIDIDSPTKQIVSYALDIAAGTLGDRRIVVDLTDGEVFPDGMLVTPDGKSLIVAFYDPRDSEAGEAHQYSLAGGQLECVWKTPGSPRVTCPQLIRRNGKIDLLLTTADEGMTPEQRAAHPHAGCLFVGPTNFVDLAAQPKWPA